MQHAAIKRQNAAFYRHNYHVFSNYKRDSEPHLLSLAHGMQLNNGGIGQHPMPPESFRDHRSPDDHQTLGMNRADKKTTARRAKTQEKIVLRRIFGF
jgi:hypothetical protein